MGNWIAGVTDPDPVETHEWIDSLDDLAKAGEPRRSELVARLAGLRELHGPAGPGTTPAVNTVAVGDEPAYPGNLADEHSVEAALRWNAATMVIRANLTHEGIGGHIATYASAATLIDVATCHHLQPHEPDRPGNQVFFQGHASPGLYARAYLQGRLTEDDLDSFRNETGGVAGVGLPSYPHPHATDLSIDGGFWEHPTVSMGIGPLNSIHTAAMHRYLQARDLAGKQPAVWCFLGDGEMDEPETMASTALAGRYGLSNLIWVVNCNLQRLDGPVRGNSSVVAELEARFVAAGWEVIKCLWGPLWDPLLGGTHGAELAMMLGTHADGDWQRWATADGDTIRSELFRDHEHIVAHLDDRQLEELARDRGGHDRRKVHAAYTAAEQASKPVVVLASTIKGYGMGRGGEAAMSAHQIKTLGSAALTDYAKRLGLDPAEAFDANGNPVYVKPGDLTPAGGPIPSRPHHNMSAPQHDASWVGSYLAGSGTGKVSTTAAFTRILRSHVDADPSVIPITCDEGRTFGWDSMIAKHGVWNPQGQRYVGVDAQYALAYRERDDGRVIQEGISEAAAAASFYAAGTSWAQLGVPLLPVWMFYSMFGFQRVADLLWAAGDARCRGILAGATAGRTALAGEGLQHCDGQSLMLAANHPSVEPWDPAFAYEVAAIVADSIARINSNGGGHDGEDLITYLALYNDNIVQPALPAHVSLEDVANGAYLYRGEGLADVRIAFSGSVATDAIVAADIVGVLCDIEVDLWSVPGWTQLRRRALDVEAVGGLVGDILGGEAAATVAVTDWVRDVPDQISRWISGRWTSLGTDGYGMSGPRAGLRAVFGVDRYSIAHATILQAEAAGVIDSVVTGAALNELEALRRS